MYPLIRRGAGQLLPLAQQAVAVSSVTLAAAADPLQPLCQQPSLKCSCALLMQRAPLHHTSSAQQHQAAAQGHGSSREHHHEHHDSHCSHNHRHQQQLQQQQQRNPGEPLSFEQQEHTCWSCHDRFSRGGLICRSCDRIQPVDSSLTYFDLMGYQQPTYDLDPAALEKRYKLLQWQLHPDKSAGKAPEERQYSEEQASLINQAYGVLRNPLSRANYMLMQAGVSADEFEHTIADPDLLMEVMEAREQVEQQHDQEQLVKLHSANKQRQAALCQQLAGAFARGDIDGARQLVAQLSYWVRLEEAICDKL
ncbi:hypothetical protein COO60DRAFT_1489839 [Scenedesmus sp. NREL 46B-D3]|nr:hypothetical protein COO60DRAFT_1489839 [Scenedesmus sp. NREL 46B-D3]